MKDSKVLKAGVAYTICSFIIKGLSFLTTPIFTRMMSKTEIGQFSVMASWISILGVTITLNLSNSVPIAKYDYKDKVDSYLSSIAILGLLTTGLFYLMCLPFRAKITEFISIPNYALLVMIAFVMVNPAIEILYCKLRVQYEYKPVILLTILSSSFSVGLSLLLVRILENKLFGRVIGYYLPLLIIDLFVMLYIICKGKCFSLNQCKYGMAICIPMVFHSLAGNLMHTSDRIMIQSFCESESVALYSVAYSGALLVNIIRNSMESAWDPWVFDMIDKGRRQEIKKYSYLYITFFALLCMAIVAVAPEFLYIMGGDGYVEAMYVVPPVVMAYYCSMIYSLYGGVERFYKKQKIFPIIAAVCAIANIGLNFIFVPTYGYIAAAYTTLFSCFLEMILHYFYSLKMGYSNIYNTSFNLLTIVGVLIVCVISVSLYRLIVVRYTIIALGMLIFLILLSVYRDKVIDYIRTIRNKKVN